MFGTTKKPPKPVVIRKISVAKPADPPHAPKASGSNGAVHTRPHSAQINGKVNGSSTKANGLLKSRDKLANGAKESLGVKRRGDSKLASPSRSLSPGFKAHHSKRKALSPSVAPDFGESSDEDEVDTEDGARKRMRPSPRPAIIEHDSKRVVFDEDTLAWTDEKEELNPIINGSDLTLNKFKEYPIYMASKESNEDVGLAGLQYPSSCMAEKFQLVQPNDSADYNPVEDMIETISHICQYYFPKAQAEYLIDEITGYPRRFRKANRDRSGPQLLTALDEFNAFITKSVEDGTISKFLRTQHSVPLPLVERILSQVYARTVSPQVSILKQYENGTDDVYGELLPRFVHQILIDTKLRSDQVFVDLGSGVGNVVLQAALEAGCESWGVERMPNPASLAAKQAAEFLPRCKRWALKPGAVTVIEGDFLATPEIDDVLKRADVVLVNNQAFTPTLNQQLTMKFLDLKEGCKIVSLRSFLPENWQIRDRNVDDPRNLLMRNEKKEYFSGSVSWTDVGGNYYVATKDSRGLRRFLRKQQERDGGVSGDV